MRFTKMHGAGNDYVYVNAWDEQLPADVPSLARSISDRHTGIGSDGLIVIGPSEVADARMRIWNADGSEAEMCGNGLRCVARYLHDHGIVRRSTLRIETGRGVVAAELILAKGRVQSVRTGVGRPVLAAARIPTSLADPPQNVLLDVAGRSLAVTAVSMGNPHCVVFLDREPLEGPMVTELGPRIERHPAFPRRANVEFVEVVAPGEMRMRVWERGAGETQACGSGACAAVVAGALTGRTGRSVRCGLPGGELFVEWTDSDEVFLTGPAEEVFSGDYPVREASEAARAA